MDLLSMTIGFLVGTATGAAGQYFGAKYTDKRRGSEARVASDAAWQDLETRFPSIIAEMRNDALDPEMASVRHFFVKTSRSLINASGPLFEYHTDVHDDLQAAVAHLERLGYIEDVTRGNCPRFRMTEELVDRLRET